MAVVRSLFFLISLFGSCTLLGADASSALEDNSASSPASFDSEEEDFESNQIASRSSRCRTSVAIRQEAMRREEIQSKKQRDLESALSEGNLQAVVIAVDNGAEIDKRCYDGKKNRTALHIAVKVGYFVIVEYLVRKQQEKIEAEYKEKISLIIEEEADPLVTGEVNDEDKDLSAIEGNEDQPLHIPLPLPLPLGEEEKKAFLLIQDYDGRTPFHLGLVKYYKKWKETSQQTGRESTQVIEKKKILDFILDCHDKVLSEVDSSRQTPFHLAAKAGDADFILTFLAKIKDDKVINSFDMKGHTALSYGVKAKSRAVEELLIKRVPEIAEQIGHPQKIFFLAVKYWRVDAVNHLCRKYNRSVLETVITGEKGSNKVILSTVDGSNNTVLHWLILSMAEKRRCGFVDGGSKESHLPVKARGQDIKTLVALLKNLIIFAEDFIDLQNLDGDTALHLAVKNGVLPAVRALLGYKANTMLENNEGQTPWGYLKKVKGKTDLSPDEYKVRELIKDNPRIKFQTIDKLHKWARSLKNKEVQKEIIRRISQ